MQGWFRRPRNDRDWEPELAVPAAVSFEGDEMRVKNIRNFRFFTPKDFTPGYADRVYQVSQLASVDMVTSYWTSPLIAHVFLSFGFVGGEFLAVSIEIRRMRGQKYSSLAGFFRQYELFYVVADERDLIGQRVNARHERVYLYRLEVSADIKRMLFCGYMRRVAKLAAAPEFYNTATNNCTTNIFAHANAGGKLVPLDWRVLASGRADKYAYELGILDQGMGFAALKAASLIDPARADEGVGGEEFSGRIREGLVGMGGKVDLNLKEI